MSFKIGEQVSDKASLMLSGVTEMASSVSQGLEDVVSCVSSGVGDIVHDISAGVKRLITSPPCNEEEEKELGQEFTYNSILPTPDHLSIVDKPSFPMGLPFCPVNASLEGTPFMEESSFVDNLEILENYFSEPEIFDIGNNASLEDIEVAIEKTKTLILSCEESTHRRRILVQRLIQLRLMKERVKEEKEVLKEGVQMKQGHHLIPVLSQLRPSSKQFCDLCLQVIWTVLHMTYRCSLCNYQCHGKCVKKEHVRCPSLKFPETPSYILTICPEVGLASQDYRCAQCRRLITRKSVWDEPRLCDYTGQYFCPACHWNIRMPSPARVVHNWDFEEQTISQQAKLFLTFASTKPLLQLEKLNPFLFKFVEELHMVKKLREELILMKGYLRTCRTAQEARLLRRLEARQHFVDDARFYSMKDLVDLNNDLLLPFLREVRCEFATHIKETCEVCRGKGFICELCPSEEVIFPFDEKVSVCEMCQASFHESCFTSVAVCPRCIRHSSRRLKSQGDSVVPS